jgi:hypothetical protein
MPRAENRKARIRSEEIDYWGRIIDSWPDADGVSLWRQHSDRVNGGLLARWLPKTPIERALKTDLFEEAVGQGLYPLPLERARSVIGIDLAKAAVVYLRLLSGFEQLAGSRAATASGYFVAARAVKH